MHCLYVAYQRHLIHLGCPPSKADWYLYKGMRAAFRVEGATPGPIVPFVIRRLASLRGLSVEVEHSVFEKGHHVVDAQNKTQRLIAQHTSFGKYVQRVTLEPAIYTLIDVSHAVFSETVPAGVPTIALQIGGK